MGAQFFGVFGPLKPPPAEFGKLGGIIGDGFGTEAV
jgi:hypothetical protein